MKFFAWAFYKIALTIIFTKENIERSGEFIDFLVDKLQKEDAESGKQTRATLIFVFEDIIKRLKEDDNVN